MTLTQMRYYEAVCRHMSLTRAAHELHITQPALSIAIREIEGKCGVELFHHGANSLSITEQGAVLYKEITALLRQYDHMQYMISQRMLKRNFVRIGYGVMSTSAFLPAVVHRFRESHSDVQVFLKEGPAIEVFDLLKSDKLDMIIVNSRHLERQRDQLASGKFACIPLITMRMCFAIGADNPLAQRRSVGWEDIVKEPLILLKSPSKMVDDIRSSLNAAGYALPVNVYFADQIYTVLRFIEENVAASFIPSTVAQDNPRIALLDFPGSYTADVTLIYNKDSAQIEAVDQFIHTITEYSKNSIL